MEGLVREEECFVLNPGLERQPVEVDAGGGDMLPWLGAGEKPEFWTYWSLARVLLGTPDRAPLH